MSEDPLDGGRVFGSVAEDYDRWRPSYPPEIVERISDEVEGRWAAEIGAGTGKATELFLASGFAVTAVEPDEDMAAVGRLRAPSATWVVAGAETWDRSGRPFDLLYGAQSWHWIDPRWDRRLAEAVRPGGALVMLWNRPDHVRRRTDFDDLYRRYLPDGDGASRRRLLHQRDDTHWIERLEAVAGHVEVLRAAWSTTMSTSGYLGLVGTYSDHLTLADARRRPLEEGIAARIDAMGGSITVDYLTVAYLGRVEG